jgi:hypothetical protein
MVTFDSCNGLAWSANACVNSPAHKLLVQHEPKVRRGLLREETSLTQWVITDTITILSRVKLCWVVKKPSIRIWQFEFEFCGYLYRLHQRNYLHRNLNYMCLLVQHTCCVGLCNIHVLACATYMCWLVQHTCVGLCNIHVLACATYTPEYPCGTLVFRVYTCVGLCNTHELACATYMCWLVQTHVGLCNTMRADKQLAVTCCVISFK